VREDGSHRLVLGDDGEHPKPTAALGEVHYVRLECAAEKGSPIQARGGGVEDASEQVSPWRTKACSGLSDDADPRSPPHGALFATLPRRL
jgi:hypothetical protein